MKEVLKTIGKWLWDSLVIGASILSAARGIKTAADVVKSSLNDDVDEDLAENEDEEDE